MELRTLVVALVAICNSAAEILEKTLSEDGEEGEGKRPRRSRKTREDGAESDEPEEKEERRSSRRSRSKDKDEDSDDDSDDDKDDDASSGDEDTPSEDDIIDAVRAAQRVLEKDEVVAVIRKYGKCDRASQVPEDRRQKVIDALDKLVDEAK